MATTAARKPMLEVTGNVAAVAREADVLQLHQVKRPRVKQHLVGIAQTAAAAKAAAAPEGPVTHHQLTTALQPVTKALAELQTGMVELRDEMVELRADVRISRSAQVNKFAFDDHNSTRIPLMPRCSNGQGTGAVGEFPQGFPATHAVLSQLNGHQLDAFETFYNVAFQGANLAARREAFRLFVML